MPLLPPLLDCLPSDWTRATLLGRLDFGPGPSVVLLRDGVLFDLTHEASTCAELLNRFDTLEALPEGRRLGPLAEVLGGANPPRLLAPIDLQCIKAAGVTFAVSMLERVIEERARGDKALALSIRTQINERIGGDLRQIVPGSAQAAELKQALIQDGLWSQYMEVAIGPDAEVFTKAPVLSAVSCFDAIGVRADSAWNNPEPEIALLCDGQGRIRGAMLGNDVNLRDFEGRSALLLGKAKDNNGSCALGPFVRLFDARYTLDDVRSAVVHLAIDGPEGFRLEGKSSMQYISRDPADLVAQTCGKNHQYPDGFALFLGTLFAPTQDRGEAGSGFTHRRGDIVRISNDRLGQLVNEVRHCHEIPPWTFGIGALLRNLAARGLLNAAS